MGSKTPMHPSRTPLHPYMTPMQDPGATPIHDGMRTPMRDRAWNPYTPMSPPRTVFVSWPSGQVAKDAITALPSELEIVSLRKNDRVKIIGDPYRGSTGELIGTDGSDGIVRLDDSLDVKILDLAILAKLAEA
ncbi:PREDICTED: putative transcription elongation factor SPT5 homolog 1 [Tarenaya hassleriana]|uniref:putative transcription elongation factor SPT5 homolog 1 n=1 Tax=Tarenaya hassleriana TaxID=28532 RepID=UPI00053C85F9|nr:PREDICTED: putative transcription elongation factor SPT5 homolog 1 [Tarenaya hassleriana]